MFKYFGYGSNINLTALKAKGVNPIASEKGILKGWRLRFNVQHWFKHEGGMGNIERTDNDKDIVEGVVHDCEDASLTPLDQLEAYGIGYDRITVTIETKSNLVNAYTYTGLPDFIDNKCKPTQRYKNIIITGAKQAGLSDAYLEHIKSQPTHPIPNYPKFHYSMSNPKFFTKKSLSKHRHLTALHGYVFDMKNSRKELDCLLDIFGGKDMTLFHLKRLDTSTGSETIRDVLNGHLSEEGKNYINTYLHEYAKEFKCIGLYNYEE